MAFKVTRIAYQNRTLIGCPFLTTSLVGHIESSHDQRSGDTYHKKQLAWVANLFCLSVSVFDTNGAIGCWD